MSEQQKLLFDEITDMSEFELQEVLLFAKYIKYRKNNAKIPARLIDKDEKELEEKLEKSINDIEVGKVHTFEEVYNNSKAILEN